MAVVGAAVLSFGVFAIAVMTFPSAWAATGSARALLLISSGSVFVTMPLALDFVLAQLIDVPALDITMMARIHGLLNAFGFVLSGLVGWTVLQMDDSEPALAWRYADGSLRPRGRGARGRVRGSKP
jgi:hypothetical protein